VAVRLYLKKNVFDAALDRIRWLFDQFPNVIVGVSGGKDSTVVFNLAMIVAREKNRLPLRCLFLDQEAEWQATIDHVTEIMESPDVEPKWYQMPLRLFNATSTTEHWLQCWDPADEAKWMRPKVPYSVKENVYGTDRFAKLFAAIVRKEYPDTPTCYIAGVRAEESPGRFMGLTESEAYGGETWGAVLDGRRRHYTMYPIYDWTYSDVWKSIHENGWSYNRLYDAMHQYGIPVTKMRVSNVHHETAVHSLFYLQEIEGGTYERLTQRIAGIDMAGKLGPSDYFGGDLPFMFRNWREYRDFLLEKLIADEKWRLGFAKRFAKQDEMYEGMGEEIVCRLHIASILTNDWEHIKLKNFESAPQNLAYKRAYQKKKREREAVDS
jgi:predicted phosphoadenosine phosphosulfate sulfurtransferase